LQLENDITSCDSNTELLVHGFNKAQVDSLATIDSIEVTTSGSSARITITPTDGPASMPWVTTAHTYVLEPVLGTRGTDRFITGWRVMPVSGCLSRGICN